MRYLNIKNNLVASVISRDEVRKTVKIEYEADGKTTDISESTLKRWWKKIEEDGPKKQDEDKAGDGTPLNEVGKEIAKQAEQKAEEVKAALKAAVNARKNNPKPKKESKTTNPEVPEIVEYIDSISKDMGMNFYIRDKQPNTRQYRFADNKVVFIVRILRQRVEIHCKSRSIMNEALGKMQTMKGFFDRKFDVEKLTAENKKTIERILVNYKKGKKEDK